MFKKLMCLLFCVFVFGVSWAHGVEYDRAAYWDSRYPSAWAGAADAGPAAMRDFFSGAGYTILDADQLKSWMDGHIADGELSVVVMCLDIMPDTVAETMDATCTIRRYLDAGGKMVVYADWPFYYQGSVGSQTTWGAAGATSVLGFNAADGSNDTYETVNITAAGTTWGLTEAWPGSRRTVSAATAAAENLTVLATINAGPSAAGWVKHYVTGDNFRGFVRYFDTDVVAGTRSPNFGDIQRLAEYIDQKAGNPDPADGSSVPAEVWETNVYMMLDFAPGFEATSHTVYFSDVEQEVIDRLSSRSLGSVPPWPTGFVVGYDDPGIPEYARAPLVYGKTYYWCVDAFDGTDTYPGEVWSFTVMPKVAWDPYPEDGDSLIPSDVTATWKLGDQDTEGKLLSYDVYLGTDETAVADANVVNNPSVAEFIGNVSTETIDFAGLAYETEYFWRVDTKLSITRPPFIPTYTKGEVWSFTTGPEGTGGLLVEYWWNIPDPLVSDLTSDVNYPHNPDSNEIIPIFETPTDQDDHFGGRVRGWLYVKAAGTYEFWLATDDYGQLWLSSDAGAANASLIASVDGWVPSRDFDNNQGSGGPNMASGPISLSAGMHYVEALYKEHEGGDNLAVAWSGPDSDGVREVIPGDQLISYYPVVADNPAPPHLALGVPVNVTLTWTGGKDRDTKAPYPLQRVYVGDSAAAVAAATTLSPEYKGEVSTDQYSPIGLAHLQNVYWRVDGVTGAGEVPYTGPVWTFRTTYDPGQIVDPNLKLWLKFEDNPLDSSGYGNDGTEIGGPTYVAGYYDRAIQLDGIDDYVSVDYEIGISGLAPRTIGGWAKADSSSIGNWTNVFGFTGPSGGGGHFDIQIVGGTNSTTQGWFGLHMYGDEYDILPNDMEWHHFAASFDGTTAYFYGDTVLIGSNAPENADGTPLTLNTPDNVHVGKRDDNSNYFPGIVDDVRIYDKVLTIKELKIAAGLLAASDPDPANGATDVSRTPTLGWMPGAFAAAVNGNVLYYGTDEDAVINRTASSITLTTPTYTAPTLGLNTDFYWAVDTVNGVDVWPGDVWTFTTSNWLSVDDMETYTPWTMPGNNIFEAWRDGEGNCTPGNGNQTGSTVTENMDMAFVLGGLQSMKYEFDNDGLVYSPCTMTITPRPYLYSKIEAQTATLPSGIGSDWTIEGVKALQINWMGQLGNSTTERLWVQLQDSSKTYGTKVAYGDQADEDIADMNDPSWHQWDIDLADFNVDLTNVVSIVIGIGDEGSPDPGGSGTIYIDDIRLYTPRCVPNRAKPAADFDNSCQVDYPDVATLFDNWLLQDVPEVPDSGWMTSDIGDVNVLTGSYTDLGGGKFRMTGAGADIWGNADGFFYRHKPLAGDGRLTVRVTDISGPSTNDWRKAGVMIRETLDAGSKHAFMATSPVGGGGKSFQRRIETDLASTSAHGIPPTVTTPICLRIARKGDTFRGFYNIGGGWVQQGDPVTIEMAENVYIGFAVTSHDYTNYSTATFDNVCSGDFIEPDLVTDGVINFEDYAEMMDEWMETVHWP